MTNGEKFRACLQHHCYGSVSRELSDEAARVMANELSNVLENVYRNNTNSYVDFLNEARDYQRRGNNRNIQKFYDEFENKVKKYLQMSGKDKMFIEKNMNSFRSILIQLYCDTGSLKRIFADYEPGFEQKVKNKVKRR